ncbi:hypothetical protein ABVT39_000655 [Epinephelus coioides]
MAAKLDLWLSAAGFAAVYVEAKDLHLTMVFRNKDHFNDLLERCNIPPTALSCTLVIYLPTGLHVHPRVGSLNFSMHCLCPRLYSTVKSLALHGKVSVKRGRSSTKLNFRRVKTPVKPPMRHRS